ncbi:MAG: hypothetical protein WD989_01200 [Candidatus Paceibacterota bacterium]
MAYLIGLFLILAFVFSATSGGNLFGELKNKFTETIFPKSQTEITVENLQNDYKTLEDFFTSSAPALLNAKGTSAETKAALEKAAAAFNNSKQLVGDLEKLAKDDKNLLEATIEKALGLDKKAGPEPTSIPPQCKLVCGK